MSAQLYFVVYMFLYELLKKEKKKKSSNFKDLNTFSVKGITVSSAAGV